MRSERTLPAAPRQAGGVPLTLLAVLALLVAAGVIVWLVQPPSRFDPQTWAATPPEDRLHMAFDFERSWPWRGATRTQLVGWLGEPEQELDAATWWLGAAPVGGTLDAPSLSVAYAAGGSGDALRVTIEAPFGPLEPRPFKPEEWAAATPAGRAAMFGSLRTRLRDLPRVDLDVLSDLLGTPASKGRALSIPAGRDWMDDGELLAFLVDDHVERVAIIGR